MYDLLLLLLSVEELLEALYLGSFEAVSDVVFVVDCLTWVVQSAAAVAVVGLWAVLECYGRESLE